MALAAFFSTSHVIEPGKARFSVRAHPDAESQFVVLDFGRVALSVMDPAILTDLAALVAEAQDLLAAALPGQDPLPVVEPIVEPAVEPVVESLVERVA